MNENTPEIIEDILTPKQERFCRNYTQNKVYFGNATLSYEEAYGMELEDKPKDDALLLLDNGTEVTQSEYNLMDSDEKPPKVKRTIEKSTYDKTYDYCSMAGSRLISNDKIQQRCRVLLNEFLTDPVIDARLIEIILKGADGDSIRAIQEYNKLKQRIITKIDHTSKGNEIKGNEIVFRDYSSKDEDVDEDVEEIEDESDTTNTDGQETETGSQ